MWTAMCTLAFGATSISRFNANVPAVPPRSVNLGYYNTNAYREYESDGLMRSNTAGSHLAFKHHPSQFRRRALG